MARYNAWQNTSLLRAASTLDDTARRRDRGAFFGSIAATFDHLLVDDRLWLARFGGNERPEDDVAPVPSAAGDWSAFVGARTALDQTLIAWAAGLVDTDARVGWYPSGGQTRIEKPFDLCVMHLFNHQTHHRGQIHAMLTAAGAKPDVTDLPMMPTGQKALR